MVVVEVDSADEDFENVTVLDTLETEDVVVELELDFKLEAVGDKVMVFELEEEVEDDILELWEPLLFLLFLFIYLFIFETESRSVAQAGV